MPERNQHGTNSPQSNWSVALLASATLLSLASGCAHVSRYRHLTGLELADRPVADKVQAVNAVAESPLAGAAPMADPTASDSNIDRPKLVGQAVQLASAQELQTDQEAWANPKSSDLALGRDDSLPREFVADRPVPLDAMVDLPIVDSAQPMVVRESQPIDLGSALGIAGGNAWAIQLARQRTVEAHAELLQAEALWLPTLQAGLGWNTHEGRIQVSEGTVIEASRSSFFLGGGATLGRAPVAGGSGGPFRLNADLALADAYFGTRIANHRLGATRFGVAVARNEAIFRAGAAYIDLLEAVGRVADAQAAFQAAEELSNLAKTFEQAGAASQADVDRAETERAQLARGLLNAQRVVRIRNASLARRLRVDPNLNLQPVDQVLVPLELTSENSHVEELIATAFGNRPEFSVFRKQIDALCVAVRKAQVEPWVPHVAMTTSAGAFSGGTGSSLDNDGGRSDVDIQALWQLDSLGMGAAANRKRARSQLAQQRLALSDFRDEVAAQVVRAYENMLNFRLQIEASEESLRLAEISLQRHVARVKADEGLPIELLQAIQARAAGLTDRTTAVAGYNRAQVELLFATGQLVP